jgi:hypothetical protein
MMAAEFADKVLQLLASVGETDEVLSNLVCLFTVIRCSTR